MERIIHSSPMISGDDGGEQNIQAPAPYDSSNSEPPYAISSLKNQYPSPKQSTYQKETPTNAQKSNRNTTPITVKDEPTTKPKTNPNQK
mmetsp:Transcript_24350/g.29450  ORF Transcript_24350/g.29450 Transcript_24350/m.29450 type:complete len:89 (+) Transcript_24350:283-549(+)